MTHKKEGERGDDDREEGEEERKKGKWRVTRRGEEKRIKKGRRGR